MTPAALRKIALALEGAHEEPHFDRTSFRFKGRIFATMTQDGEQAMVRVPVEAVSMMLDSDPDVFFSYGKWTTNQGAIGVRLANVDAGLMKQLLTSSYRQVVAKASPKKRAATSKRKTSPGAKKKTAARPKRRASHGHR